MPPQRGKWPPRAVPELQALPSLQPPLLPLPSAEDTHSVIHAADAFSKAHLLYKQHPWSKLVVTAVMRA